MSTVLSAMEKAVAAWGPLPPDWVRALAEECDAASLRKVAATLSVSPAMVSLAIGNKREKLGFIKARVESVLMVTIVACPVLGVLGRNECLREQSRPFSSANPLRIQLYRACHGGCPHYKERDNEYRGEPGEDGRKHGKPVAARQRRFRQNVSQPA